VRRFLRRLLRLHVPNIQNGGEKCRHSPAPIWNIPDFRKRAANTDPKAVMFQTFAKLPHIGTNGGTAAGLVGRYDKVAARIREFHAAGIELFMLQFQPMEAEMMRFAAEVMPRVRRLKAVA
jgi:alkanesulfonate monooxygenase SsuD/methylene tetrahydromethanopterin reductase-like flavin-dependent oxidoreductase (luciferase family)